MFVKNTFVKIYVFDVDEKQDSVKKSKIIVNKIIFNTKSVWIGVIKHVYNLFLIINCRKQGRFNLGDWWIMHLHHIGLPPATNRYPKLPVSGNPLIKTKLI